MIIFSSAEQYEAPLLQTVGSKGRLWWKRTWFRLACDYYFEWGEQEARKRIFMRAGFEYEKSSKPKIVGLIGFNTDENPAASMFHDRLYRDAGRWTKGEFEYQVLIDGAWVQDSSTWHRKEADNLYEMVSIIEGQGKAQSKIEKWAVKLYPPNWFKGF